MVILAIAFLVFCGVCATMESKTTGLFKAFGVYGRVTAYLSMFAPLGFIMFIYSFFPDGVKDGRWGYLLMGILGSGLYYLVYLRCPPFLRKKVILSLLISGFGVTMKIILFFVRAVWNLQKPKEMVDSKGRTVYVFQGEVYSPHGKHLGSVTDTNRFIEIDS